MSHTLRLLALLLVGGGALAGTDANQASVAELDGIRGIGPGLSARILATRSTRAFRDWQDFIARVPGVGPARAQQLSAAGLTVGGRAYAGGAAGPGGTGDAPLPAGAAGSAAP